MSVNKVILVGRLGRDPEIRYTPGGQAVLNFSIATDESYKDRNGERQKRTEQAEVIQKFLKKGNEAYFEGRLRTREWQDREGQKRTTTEIMVTDFRFIGSRGEGMAAGAGAGAGMGRPEESEQPGGSAEEYGGGAGPEIGDEDIPF
jgi:single-strand DNA-binding protein